MVESQKLQILKALKSFEPRAASLPKTLLSYFYSPFLCRAYLS
jgi:hypothetical protein